MQHVPKVSAAWFQMNAFCYGNETVWNLSSWNRTKRAAPTLCFLQRMGWLVTAVVVHPWTPALPGCPSHPTARAKIDAIFPCMSLFRTSQSLWPLQLVHEWCLLRLLLVPWRYLPAPRWTAASASVPGSLCGTWPAVGIPCPSECWWATLDIIFFPLLSRHRNINSAH